MEDERPSPLSQTEISLCHPARRTCSICSNFRICPLLRSLSATPLSPPPPGPSLPEGIPIDRVPHLDLSRELTRKRRSTGRTRDSFECAPHAKCLSALCQTQTTLKCVFGSRGDTRRRQIVGKSIRREAYLPSAHPSSVLVSLSFLRTEDKAPCG